MNKFLYFKTKNVYNDMDPIQIDKSISFVEDEDAIYTHGHKFGGASTTNIVDNPIIGNDDLPNNYTTITAALNGIYLDLQNNFVLNPVALNDLSQEVIDRLNNNLEVDLSWIDLFTNNGQFTQTMSNIFSRNTYHASQSIEERLWNLEMYVIGLGDNNNLLNRVSRLENEPQHVILTQEEYDNLQQYDDNTLYFIIGDTTPSILQPQDLSDYGELARYIVACYNARYLYNQEKQFISGGSVTKDYDYFEGREKALLVSEVTLYGNGIKVEIAIKSPLSFRNMEYLLLFDAENIQDFLFKLRNMNWEPLYKYFNNQPYESDNFLLSNISKLFTDKYNTIWNDQDRFPLLDTDLKNNSDDGYKYYGTFKNSYVFRHPYDGLYEMLIVGNDPSSSILWSCIGDYSHIQNTIATMTSTDTKNLHKYLDFEVSGPSTCNASLQELTFVWYSGYNNLGITAEMDYDSLDKGSVRIQNGEIILNVRSNLASNATERDIYFYVKQEKGGKKVRVHVRQGAPSQETLSTFGWTANAYSFILKNSEEQNSYTVKWYDTDTEFPSIRPIPFFEGSDEIEKDDVKYRSLNPSIVSIDYNTGEFILHKTGIAVIEAVFYGNASYATATSQCTITVNDQEYDKLTLSDNEFRYDKNSYTKQIGFDNGVPYPTLINTKQVDVQYISDDPSIARVQNGGSYPGAITVIAPGETYITAKTSGTKILTVDNISEYESLGFTQNDIGKRVQIYNEKTTRYKLTVLKNDKLKLDPLDLYWASSRYYVNMATQPTLIIDGNNQYDLYTRRDGTVQTPVDPELVNKKSLNVQYTIQYAGDDLETIINNNVINLKKSGSAVIFAKFFGNETYLATTVSSEIIIDNIVGQNVQVLPDGENGQMFYWSIPALGKGIHTAYDGTTYDTWTTDYGTWGPTYPNLVNNTDVQPSFESSNPNIASIDDNGTITVNSPGSVIITATLPWLINANDQWMVYNNDNLESIEDGVSYTVYQGKSVKYMLIINQIDNQVTQETELLISQSIPFPIYPKNYTDQSTTTGYSGKLELLTVRVVGTHSTDPTVYFSSNSALTTGIYPEIYKDPQEDSLYYVSLYGDFTRSDYNKSWIDNLIIRLGDKSKSLTILVTPNAKTSDGLYVDINEYPDDTVFTNSRHANADWPYRIFKCTPMETLDGGVGRKKNFEYAVGILNNFGATIIGAFDESQNPIELVRFGNDYFKFNKPVFVVVLIRDGFTTKGGGINSPKNIWYNNSPTLSVRTTGSVTYSQQFSLGTNDGYRSPRDCNFKFKDVTSMPIPSSAAQYELIATKIPTTAGGSIEISSPVTTNYQPNKWVGINEASIDSLKLEVDLNGSVTVTLKVTENNTGKVNFGFLHASDSETITSGVSGPGCSGIQQDAYFRRSLPIVQFPSSYSLNVDDQYVPYSDFHWNMESDTVYLNDLYSLDGKLTNTTGLDAIIYSSHPNVATVNNDGSVILVGIGTTYIHARINAYSANGTSYRTTDIEYQLNIVRGDSGNESCSQTSEQIGEWTTNVFGFRCPSSVGALTNDPDYGKIYECTVEKLILNDYKPNLNKLFTPQLNNSTLLVPIFDSTDSAKVSVRGVQLTDQNANEYTDYFLTAHTTGTVYISATVPESDSGYGHIAAKTIYFKLNVVDSSNNSGGDSIN